MTKWDRQLAALFHAPNICLEVMLYVDNTIDHWFTLLFTFLPLRNFWKGCGHCTWWCQIPGDNMSILLWHNKNHRLHVWQGSIFIECPWICVKEIWLVILDNCALLIAEDHRHHLRHLCRVCIFSKGLDNEVWVLVLQLFSGWQMLLGELVFRQILHYDAKSVVRGFVIWAEFLMNFWL